ncbi:uncharacterized protein LY89DRAFT_688147 [Mollisia scopiformis]|uniref:Uncharacterized protein n=1 Tax=Mollisia scopiformis TaxID=149040 RepID=A0A194WWV5_MOLSC|nr:uncharacterized protein LY89DRAFT_688147 [Mollisia scopiformis]KUJ12458.1 hypothetical protein LY89DRAFT_688147 [Mollisia scopiformis]
MFGEEDSALWGPPQALLEKKRGGGRSMRLAFLCLILWMASSASFGGLIALWGLNSVNMNRESCGDSALAMTFWDPLIAK